MSNLKNFKLFTESYSDDLSQVLSNDENEFVVMKGDNIISGFEFIEDAFENLGEILEGDSVLSEEQRYEFNDMVSELSVNDEMDQFEIDETLNKLLDIFEIVEPYKIQVRSELEETPIEVEGDYDEGLEPGEEGYDEFEEELLGESVSSDPFCIVGDLNGKTEEIDSFLDEDEANGYIDEYKSIYNEFENMKVIHRELLENVDTNEQESDLHDSEDSKCSCGSDCDCEKSDENHHYVGNIKSFKDFI